MANLMRRPLKRRLRRWRSSGRPGTRRRPPRGMVAWRSFWRLRKTHPPQPLDCDTPSPPPPTTSLSARDRHTPPSPPDHPRSPPHPSIRIAGAPTHERPLPSPPRPARPPPMADKGVQGIAPGDRCTWCLAPTDAGRRMRGSYATRAVGLVIPSEVLQASNPWRRGGRGRLVRTSGADGGRISWSRLQLSIGGF